MFDFPAFLRAFCRAIPARKGDGVRVDVPRPEIPEIAAGREGVVFAARDDGDILIKFPGKGWPVSYSRGAYTLLYRTRRQ